MIWLYIAAGGAVGALARFGLASWVQTRVGLHFPWGTLVVNLTGSLLIGASLRYFEATSLSVEVRALVIVGLLGAFTTFSTFTYETVLLLEEGALARAAAYSLGSVVLGVVAVYVGMAAGGLLVVKG